jgi:hypothetical protein
MLVESTCPRHTGPVEVIGDGASDETSDQAHMDVGHDEQGETAWEDEAEAARALGYELDM